MSALRILRSTISETAWQRTVTDYADVMHWRWYHVNDSRRDRRGFPDLVLVRGGRLIFAELKKQDGTLRAEQADWLRDIEAMAGVETYIWRPSDWSEVEEVLR